MSGTFGDTAPEFLDLPFSSEVSRKTRSQKPFFRRFTFTERPSLGPVDLSRLSHGSPFPLELLSRKSRPQMVVFQRPCSLCELCCCTSMSLPPSPPIPSPMSSKNGTARRAPCSFFETLSICLLDRCRTSDTFSSVWQAWCFLHVAEMLAGVGQNERCFQKSFFVAGAGRCLETVKSLVL